jgi:RHS repeat-associated protein
MLFIYESSKPFPPSADQVTTYSYASGGLSSDLFTNWLLREVTYPAGDAGGSTTVLHGYNRLGQRKSREDQSGNLIDTEFDGLGREIKRIATTVVSGFDARVRRIETAYLTRGLPSTVTQYNATSSGTVLDQVQYAYDGWGNGTNIYQDVDSAISSPGVSSSGRSAFNFATTWSTSTSSGGVHAHRVTSIASRAGGTAFSTVDYGYGTGSDSDSNRVSELTMNSGANTLAKYTYLGMGAVVTTQLKDAGLITSVETAAGVYGDLDNFGRPIKWNWYRDGADSAAGFYNTTIAYDRNSNPVSTTNNVHSGFVSGLRFQDNLYTLDGLNRVTLADQGNLSGGTISGRTRKEAWPVLDLTGNWIERTLDHNGDGSITGLADRDEQTNKGNSFNTANEWLDSDQKKAAATGFEKFVPTYTYDANGHQTAEEIAKVLTAGAGTTYERRFFTYDPFGRMTAVHSDSGKTVLIAEYRYNGLGQRIMWRYDQNANGTVASTERFFYMYDDRWRMVGAFLDSGSTPQESFVYHAAGNAGRGSSSYIDSVVMRDRDTNADGTLEERRYYVQNWRADVVAVTKSDGSPLQYVVYSPYGEPVTHAVADVDLDGDVDSNDQAAWANGAVNSTFAYVAQEDLNHDGTDSAADDALFDESYGDNVGLSGRGRLSSGKLDNRKGYAGYEQDESITMYHVRHRVYRADLGRWMTRDPLGYVDGMGLYEYVGGMAVRGRDPSGLARAVPCAGNTCEPPKDERDRFFPVLTGCLDDVLNTTCGTACAMDPENLGITLIDPKFGLPYLCCICKGNIERLYPSETRPPFKHDPDWEEGFDAIVRCTTEHELRHGRQVIRNRDCAECDAYKATKECLPTELEMCESQRCRDMLNKRIKKDAEMEEYYCNKCKDSDNPLWPIIRPR